MITITSLQKTVLLGALSMLLFMQPIKGQSTSTNIYSQVNENRTEIICKSPTQAMEKHKINITIFNEKGLGEANFSCNCDLFRDLQKFSGEIFNAQGKSVRKIKKSELKRTEYSSYLRTDDYLYYYECYYPTYPFTIQYEWEIKCNNGLIYFPTFAPQGDFQQLLLGASYRLEMPAGETCRYKVVNDLGKQIKITESKGKEGQQIIEASVSNLPVIESEPLSPPISQLLPLVHFSPTDFTFDNTKGSMETWKDFGAWQYNLLDGRDQLTEPFKQKIHELTASCKSDKEKVKVIYDYLAANTRYVSIQLGIGGWQPISASEVCKSGFGDCKGLSNYVRAMLKELGIPSTYTVISTTNEKLLKDYASLNQMNHVILQVPLPNDTIWLECTNAQLPFGYVHQNIAGHDALMIKPDGGKVCQLPTYADSLNTQNIKAYIEITPEGSAKISATDTRRLFQYQSLFGIKDTEPNSQKDILRKGIYLNQADIQNIVIKEDKSSHPNISIGYDIRTNQYGHKTGSRLFIPANVFREASEMPATTKRIHPICIEYGYNDTDSIHIRVPEGYEIEGIPESMNKSNKFGSFSSTIQVKDKEVVVVNRLYMRKGVYKPEDFQDFVNFRKLISGQYNGSIILKKK